MSKLSLVVAVLLVVPAMAVAPYNAVFAKGATAESCRLVVEAPFLYAGMVIPMSSVQCDQQVSRLRIETRLLRDGTEAESARRQCRNSSVCWLTTDAAASDVPGDQVWCTHAVGYQGSRFIGESTVCETGDF